MGTRDHAVGTDTGSNGAVAASNGTDATSDSTVSTEGWTLPALVAEAAATHGNREFLAFEDGRTVSFAELDELTDRLATALADLGLEPGDRLLGLLTNSAEFMLLMIAAHKRRAIFVPVNTDLRGAFLEHQVRNSEPRIVAVDHGLLDRFDDVGAPGVPIDATLLVDDGSGSGAQDPPGRSPAAGDAASTPTSGAAAPGATMPDGRDAAGSVAARSGANVADGALVGAAIFGVSELLDTVPRAEAVLESEPSDVCTIMYTSGTTGPAKGVLMPQAHCYLFGLTAAQRLQIAPDDRFFCCMPLFHANGLFMQVYASLHGGASVYVTKRFSVGQWLDIVIDEGITLTNALGVMP